VHSLTGLGVAFAAPELGHTHRMSRLCERIARLSGEPPDRCHHIRLATVMHDIGKTGIPAAILLKPGPLYRILSGSRNELLDMAASVALTHHERMDGSGYPRGLRGEEIPLEGRIAAVGDVFDALTNDRVYRRALPVEHALDIMRAARSSRFDPDLLDVFVASFEHDIDPRVHTAEPALC
jgi:putative two-component system response regulator